MMNAGALLASGTMADASSLWTLLQPTSAKAQAAALTKQAAGASNASAAPKTQLAEGAAAAPAAALSVSDQAVSAASQMVEKQMQFDFFFESRSEELTLFRERSAALAEGMPDAQRQSFQYTSNKVAIRFSMSASISGEALAGFNETSETAFKEKMSEFFDRFMAAVNKLMEGPDSWLNEFLSGFSGDITGDKQKQLDEMLNEFLNALFGDKGKGNQLHGNGTQLQSMKMGVQMEFSFSMSIEAEFAQGELQEADPLVFDLNGDGFNLTSVRDGASFDLLGNGSRVQTGFVNGGDAFLALDLNGDGQINSGKELFGDQNGARNGFEELRKYDSNGDSVINARDTDFSRLLLWRDNGNGISETGELVSLCDLGISDICLKYKETDQQAAGGNRITEIASFKYADGRTGKVGDAQLSYLA